MLNSVDIIRILKDELNENGIVTLQAYGESMYPTFKSGDIVKIVKGENVKNGDVICYWLSVADEYTIVIHRVVLLRKNYVLTKGDNNNFIDPLKITKNQIIGKILNC